VQEELTRLVVRLVPDPAFDASSEAQIASLVRKLFGPAMRHEIDLVKAIPQEPSGKYRFCISKVAAERLKELSA
jgi:phenylacetate-CoA ligase